MTPDTTSGVPLDHDALIAEIEAEARRLRESGEIDEAFLDELDRVFEQLVPDETGERDFASALDKAERESLIDVHPPADSNLPGGAPVKRAVRKLMLWYMDFVAGQVTNLAGSLTRATRLLGGRVEGVEARISELEAEQHALRDELRGTAMRSLRSAEGAVPLDTWFGALQSALEDTSGRVLWAGAAAHDAVARLTATGIDAYGVDPVGDTGSESDLDVRTEAVVEHLSHTGVGSVSAVVLCGFIDDATTGERVRAVELAVESLRDDGRLCVLASDPDAWAADRSTVQVDLAPGRPLRPATWEVLMTEAGLGDVSVHQPPDGAGGSFLVTGVKGGAAPS